MVWKVDVQVQEKLSRLSQETKDSLREMNQKQTSLGVALSGVQAEVERINLILTSESRFN